MTAQAVIELVATYRRLADPASDPDAAWRQKMRDFWRQHLDSKGSKGSSLEEAEAALRKAFSPAEQWPPHEYLARLLREVFTDPASLPSGLSPPAQFFWLASETEYPAEVRDSARFRLFPSLTPPEANAAAGAALAYRLQEWRQSHIEGAVFETWTEIQAARGRPANELIFGNCLRELGLIKERDGREIVDFNGLKDVADPELRHATLAAAWEAAEESESRVQHFLDPTGPTAAETAGVGEIPA